MKTTTIVLGTACLLLLGQSCKKTEMQSKKAPPVLTANTDGRKKLDAVTDMVSGLYKIVGLNSYWVASKYINIYGTADFDLADQEDYSVGTGQDWAINDLGGGDFALIDLNSMRALAVPNSVVTSGVQLWQEAYTGATNQKWQIVYQGYGLYRI